MLDIFTPYLGFEPAWQDGGVVLVLRGLLSDPTVTESGSIRSEVVHWRRW